MANVPLGEFSWERMIGAVNDVRQRLLRACAALELQDVLYAVAGENAAAHWISQVDPSAVRNTPAVEIVIRKNDLSIAAAALESAGFVTRSVNGKNLFLERDDANLRDAVEILLADSDASALEGFRINDVTGAQAADPFRVLSLDALVRVALASFRRIDRVCLRDLADVGLIDETWCEQLPDELTQRLREILADPDG